MPVTGSTDPVKSRSAEGETALVVVTTFVTTSVYNNSVPTPTGSGDGVTPSARSADAAWAVFPPSEVGRTIHAKAATQNEKSQTCFSYISILLSLRRTIKSMQIPEAARRIELMTQLAFLRAQPGGGGGGMPYGLNNQEIERQITLAAVRFLT